MPANPPPPSDSQEASSYSVGAAVYFLRNGTSRNPKPLCLQTFDVNEIDDIFGSQGDGEPGLWWVSGGAVILRTGTMWVQT